MSLQKGVDQEPGFHPEIPVAFSSLSEARNSLDYHWNTCIHILNDLEAPIGSTLRASLRQTQLQADREACAVMLKKWRAAFHVFLQNKGKSLEEKGLQAARILEISQMFFAIYVDVSAFDILNDEQIWDKYRSRYEHILELATLIIKPNTQDINNRKQSPNFSLDMNVVAPLYAVAHRCRDPYIRRKAVCLLYAAPRQEGVWNSILTARVVEKLIRIEEGGLGTVTCAQDVPDWARISDVHAKFDHQGRMGTVHYTRPRSMHDRKREAVMQAFSW